MNPAASSISSSTYSHIPNVKQISYKQGNRLKCACALSCVCSHTCRTLRPWTECRAYQHCTRTRVNLLPSFLINTCLLIAEEQAALALGCRRSLRVQTVEPPLHAPQSGKLSERPSTAG